LELIGKNLGFVNSFALECDWLPAKATPRNIVFINLKNHINLSKELEQQYFVQYGEYNSRLCGRDITYETMSLSSLLACLEYQSNTGSQIAFMTADLRTLESFSENMWELAQFTARTKPLVLQILINFESKFRESIGLYMLLKNNMCTPVHVYIYLLAVILFRAAGLPELPSSEFAFFKEEQTDEINVGLFFDPLELEKYFSGKQFKLLDLADVNKTLNDLRILIHVIEIGCTTQMIL
jgi:hypothetical protein